MSTVSSADRDWQAVLHGFQRWLTEHWPTADAITVTMADAVRTNGFSSESALLNVSWRGAEGERSRGLVLRLPPAGDGVFPSYDLVRQARTMELARKNGVPAPEIVAVEEDPEYAGAPFLAMELVSGRIPADEAPQYCVAGWLYQATPEQQRVLYDEFHDMLADIGAIADAHGQLSFLYRRQGPGLAGELEWWADYLSWATDNAPPTEMVEVLDWLREHRPDPEPPAGLIWGDARFGNVIFDDGFRVRAVLDWEMAGVGPAEVDLGWSFAIRRSIQRGNNLPLDAELPGFPDRGRTLERYARRLGRTVDSLDWYEVFAMLRMGATLKSLSRLLVQRGITDHIVHTIPPLQDWIYELMERAS
ncbi:phosphotransferase enzyme family protein [Mycolicibacterium hassiacum DSM 44199]|jgi:aminoglycoside phosphotransferase (APT) family kinase protein|uniref:Phosphotransferase enzyme family protein n=2 Tax=Mycolicibacterium hassiacum TaxID=46351 RepID=K5BIX6_MYCHD|nr:phosphotransferase family protein [Mycolicibacterium hassiacum]EKF22129.1 phosphotransferase enzyme family protein [Mycolicibacterium hassiacum DSM 44199]MBX5485230.1 phosphotransferase family protein [Mycolicibacterium hassiacum]MDA4086573.1 phosphotransferase [Mycolicibacterium hassiacum DSM 44199]PZN24508.1 MAG: phosphotransferase family protein [Mycolicibacterium hassiacum]VCT92030.1 Putative aminoglycoside phosphotransferase [Mycolicibacterium hassiacum DSM 44199]